MKKHIERVWEDIVQLLEEEFHFLLKYLPYTIAELRKKIHKVVLLVKPLCN